jgi:hypothetical protein
MKKIQDTREPMKKEVLNNYLVKIKALQDEISVLEKWQQNKNSLQDYTEMLLNILSYNEYYYRDLFNIPHYKLSNLLSNQGEKINSNFATNKKTILSILERHMKEMKYEILRAY